MSNRAKGSFAVIALLGLALWWLALAGRKPASEPAAYVLVEDPPAQSAAPPPKAATAGPAEPRPERTEPASAPDSPIPPAPAPAAPEQAPQTPKAKAPIPPDSRGFLDALRGRFEGEPRDSAASEVEDRIRRMFRAEGMPSGLLRDVLCRELVCRLELHWTPEHDEPYRSAMQTLIGANAKTMATDASPPDANGAVEVKAYWRRMVDNLPP